MSASFLKSYLSYIGESETPVTFNRWSALAGIGAILERNVNIPFGHSHIHPNLYTMLIGSSGSRKSSAINLMKSMLTKAGYTSIAAERTSKEKFLLDLAGEDDTQSNTDGILEKNLFGNIGAESEVTPYAILADEANDFFGISNMEFLSILGRMWDWNTVPYTNKIKTGKSVSIPNPTITILSGNTQTGFTTAFPPDIIGQGFFSRLLLIYGEPNNKEIAFPEIPDPLNTSEIVREFQYIKSYHRGEVPYSSTGKKLLAKIYSEIKNKPVSDPRFVPYFQRRFTHLLKLCLVVAASRLEKEITEGIVVEANTYLSYAEYLMPKALGEFGKSRNSDVTHKILSYIESNDGVTLKQLMKVCSADLDKPTDIGDIIRKLSMTDKIQNVAGLFLPMRQKGLESRSGMIDLSYLTEEELLVKG